MAKKCPSGKAGFKTELDAKIAIARYTERETKHRKQGRKRVAKRWYRCPDCGLVHLTSQNRSRTPASR